MVAIWLLTDWEDRVFNGWLVPVLGIIFLPWTTVLYTIGFVWGGDTAVPWGILGRHHRCLCRHHELRLLVEADPAQLSGGRVAAHF